MTLAKRVAPPCNGPFQDALVAEYSARLSAASEAIMADMTTRHKVADAELAHAIAWAASRGKGAA